MDKKTTEQLKLKLEAEKKSLEKELKNFAEKDNKLKHNWDARYPNREDSDKDEEADEVQEYDNMLALEHSLESKLKDVNEALEKMSRQGRDPAVAGEYGKCEKCGKVIDEARLEVAPEAKLCMKCKLL